MLTLSQVEPRTPITNTTAVTIGVPGSYYLTANITVSTGDGIDINVNGVTFDLNGFTISSTAATPNGTAILLNGGNTDITILNGHILGTGFANGIYLGGYNVRVVGVSVSGSAYGIILGTANSTVVDSCTVQSIGVYGIQASSVSHSSAYQCGGVAIIANTVDSCYGNSTGSSDGLYVGTANNCYGYSSSGYGLYATTATGCYGLTGSGPAGLDANNAINCYGVSSGSGPGLLATTASNCQGQNNGSGDGLDAAQTATGCYGYSLNGNGLSATNANNCNGQSGGSGTGLSASAVATGCSGVSSIGVGLQATVANTCSGQNYNNSMSGTFGLRAYIANNCYAIGNFGLGATIANSCYSSIGDVNIIHTYNMP
jgi:hypothetical protein